MMLETVVIDYTNHKGIRTERMIIPMCIWYGETKYHPGNQWMLKATDVLRNDERDFAMNQIHSWRPARYGTLCATPETRAEIEKEKEKAQPR